MQNQVFNTFWYGPELSPLHWACLKSFADRGHRLRVFTYEPLKLPPGVLREDAAQFVSQSELFEFDESFGAFSDIFRYELLMQEGGWWVDSDVYCLKEDIIECDYAWAAEDDQNINGAILKFPSGDPTLRSILAEARQIGSDVKVWGEIGPHLLTKHLAGREFPNHYGSTQAFYPVHWIETHLLWQPFGNDFIQARCTQSPFVHLWGSMFRHFGIDIGNAAPEGSFLCWMEGHSDFYRDLTPLDPEIQVKTIQSINAFLGRKWVKEKWERLFGPGQTQTSLV
jgi:hypothetical protein